MEIKEKISGMLYGLALGDTMGMPGELWSRRHLKEKFGLLETFLNGPPENNVACNYKAGQFTDDTSQALLILDTLAKDNYIPQKAHIAQALLKWAEQNNAFENNILGPTSKKVLCLIQQGKETKEISDTAVSNGSAMRIAPIGALFSVHKQKKLCNYVKEICAVTHSSDIAVAGACLIASAVSWALECEDTKEAVLRALELETFALTLGAETFSPSLSARVKLGIEYCTGKTKEQTADFLYNVIGCGINISESVPAALIAAYFSNTPWECALFCANLGGDTDTIGAMATAICGAAYGLPPAIAIKTIEAANNIDFRVYCDILKKGRKSLHNLNGFS